MNYLDTIVDKIVIEELKIAFKLNSTPDKIDCSDDILPPDEDLLKSIETVLKYYMTPGEFWEWEESRNDVT